MTLPESGPRATEAIKRWPRLQPAPEAVFLDVDGTLLPHTTSFLLTRRLVRRRLVSRRALAWAAWYGLRHRTGSIDYAGLLRSTLPVLARFPLVDLERMSYECFVEDIKPRLYPGLVEHLNTLRADGARLLLVSSSPAFVIAPLGYYLGCTDLIATSLRIERGRIVGLGPEPLCYGAGKRTLAERWAAKQGISMDSTAGYADNWSDRHLLEIVGRAVVVAPRGRMARLARRRGWSIVWPLPPQARPGRGSNSIPPNDFGQQGNRDR